MRLSTLSGFAKLLQRYCITLNLLLEINDTLHHYVLKAGFIYISLLNPTFQHLKLLNIWNH